MLYIVSGTYFVIDSIGYLIIIIIIIIIEYTSMEYTSVECTSIEYLIKIILIEAATQYLLVRTTVHVRNCIPFPNG